MLENIHILEKCKEIKIPSANLSFP